MKKSAAKKPVGHFHALGQTLQAQRDHLSRLVQLWAPILGLDRWELDSLFHLQPPEDWPGTLAAPASARCCCDWRYKTVTVEFLLPRIFICNNTESNREYIVVHELCHAVVHQMRGVMKWDDNDMANEERVVTELAHAFLRAKYGTSKAIKGGKPE